MEHGFTFVKFITAILFAVLLAMPIVHAEEQRIAIIVGAKSSITTISAKEVRRAYLGASIVLNGIETKPLLNLSNKLAEEVFLQKVMFMSADAYERQLISRTFQGGIRPKAYESLPALLKELNNDNAAISFMLYEDATNIPEIRIIGNL
jgi:hypothetical protein